MSDFSQRYAIPPEVARFIDDGFLQFLTENEAEKTLEFHIPALRQEDEEGRITTFSIIWIHPQFNEQFCHYFDQKPGDLANFYVIKDTTDLGDEWLEVPTLDDLIDWLQEHSKQSKPA